MVAWGIAALAVVTVHGPNGADAASLNLSWHAPTTNIDGSPLIDLAGYNIYLAASPPACATPPLFTVASPEAAPSPGEIVAYQLSGLVAGTTYSVAVSAVDTTGFASECSVEASGAAWAGFTVSPTSVDFGETVVGTPVDRTFTVQNITDASLTVTVNAPAPFTLVSGTSYTVAAGATQDVVVRFVPSTTATFTGNVNFTADGDTISRGVTARTQQPSLIVTYDGKLRDRIEPGNLGLGTDGELDGTLTATLSATGGRTITKLKLQSGAPGSWDTDATTSAWVLGVAPSLESPLFNDPATMAVNFTVADGGSFRVFAADFADIEFAPGTPLTLTATFSDGTTATGVTVATAVVPTTPPSLTLAYNGKLRGRVGPGNLGLDSDGQLDGTFTATLSATGGRTITRLQLQSSAPGTWDTDPATSAWVLGVATSLDGALLNDQGTMAINFVVPDGGSFRLFAADFADVEFAPGTTLTLSATFSDGTTATAVTVGAAISPATPPSLTLAYNGKLRDRVAASNIGLGADGALDGTFTATLSAPGGRTITKLKLQSSAPGTWDTDPATTAWALGVATSLDATLLNDPATTAVSFTVPDQGTFELFAADWADIEFVPGTTLTLTATFSDGSTATGVTVAAAAPPPAPPSLTLSYTGKLRDRVGVSNIGLGADGALDGTLTATLSATGGRTITRLQLQSNAPGTWDTDADSSALVLGVATSLDGPLLNDPNTMAVNLTVPDGGSFQLFATDFAGIEFVPGTTLTLTATLSDGTTATAVTVVTAVGAPVLTLGYSGKLRDRVGPGNFGLGGDGALDGVFTATLSAAGGRTITRLQLQSSAPGSWDTDAATSSWILGVATSLDGALLNDPGTMAVNLVVPDGGTLYLFASDFAGIEFVPGSVITITATFSDGATASATTTTVATVAPPVLTLSYDGKLRDRVGAGNLEPGPDGELDATFTATLSAAGGRTITRLTLQSSAPGTWDTDSGTSAWVLGAATSLDGPLLNDPDTTAVSFAIADGGSIRLFAADFADIEFVSGVTLRLTALFSDGSSATGSVTVP